MTTHSRTPRVIKTVVTAVLICAASMLHAADNKPLRILVGYQAGGSSDTLARMLADELQKSLGRTVLVENKPGAGGRIAAETLAKSPGDGNTVMVAPNGLTTVQSIVCKSELRYDPAKDLVPVAKLVNTPIAIAVSNAIGVQDAKQLAAWARAHPEKANFGSPAAGGLPHFIGLSVAGAMQQKWLHAAYKGGAPTALALLANEIPIGVTSIDDFIQHDRAGKLKLIAVTGAARSALAPQVPTLREQGFDVSADGWSALWTSPGTPAVEIDKLSDGVRQVLDKPEIKARLLSASFEADFKNAAELHELQKSEWARWMPIVEASGFKPNN